MLSKNMQAAADGEEDKGGSLSAGAKKMGLLLPPTLVALRGDKGKHSHRNQSAAVSASARKWIHVIWTLPEGTELLMTGLSILVEPLYPISTLSQPIQLPLLIAFLLSLPASQPLCLFWRGLPLTNVFLRSHPSLTLIFCCQRMCLPVCVCVWISNGGWHCVCRGKG